MSKELIEAILNNKIDDVKNLLAAGHNVNFQDEEGNTLLIFAARIGSRDILEVLMQNKASLRLKNNRGTTPLMEAVWFGRKSCVEYLITEMRKIGLSLDDFTVGGWHVLSHALKAVPTAAHLEIIKILVNSNINLQWRNKISKTALMEAAEHGRDISIECFFKAILEKHQSLKCIDLEIVDADGFTALFHAAFNGHLKVVKLLVKNRSNLRHKNKLGMTPLMLAIESGKMDCAIYMLKSMVRHNVSLDDIDNNDESALCYVFRYNATWLLKFFFENIDFLKHKDKEGNTCLMTAVKYNAGADIVEYIAKKMIAIGLSLDDKNKNGQTALMFAVMLGHHTLVEILIRLNTVHDFTTDQDEDHLLLLAVAHSHTKVVQVLLKYGFNIKSRNNLGVSVLSILGDVIPMVMDDIDLIRILLNHGACIDMLDNERRTPRVFIVQKNNSFGARVPEEGVLLLSKVESLFEMLDLDDDTFKLETFIERLKGLKFAANARSVERNGNSLLHMAFIKKKFSCVEPLILTGADYALINFDGQTPLFFARGQSKELIEYYSVLSKTMKLEILLKFSPIERIPRFNLKELGLQDIKDSKEVKESKESKETKDSKDAKDVNEARTPSLLDEEKNELDKIRNEDEMKLKALVFDILDNLKKLTGIKKEIICFKLGMVLSNWEYVIFDPVRAYHLLKEVTQHIHEHFKQANHQLYRLVMLGYIVFKASESLSLSADNDIIAERGEPLVGETLVERELVGTEHVGKEQVSDADISRSDEDTKLVSDKNTKLVSDEDTKRASDGDSVRTEKYRLRSLLEFYLHAGLEDEIDLMTLINKLCYGEDKIRESTKDKVKITYGKLDATLVLALIQKLEEDNVNFNTRLQAVDARYKAELRLNDATFQIKLLAKDDKLQTMSRENERLNEELRIKEKELKALEEQLKAMQEALDLQAEKDKKRTADERGVAASREQEQEKAKKKPKDQEKAFVPQSQLRSLQASGRSSAAPGSGSAPKSSSAAKASRVAPKNSIRGAIPASRSATSTSRS